MLKAKWKSVTRHIVNLHDNHGALFPACQHDTLEERSWLIAGSKAHKELEAIVNGKPLLRDIGQLSPAEQTSSLESFHKTIIFFAPKSIHFSYSAMKARILLAVLHFNENSACAQAVTQKGQSRWGISFPKSRKGDPIVKQVKVPPSYSYVTELLEEVLQLRQEYPSYQKAKILLQQGNLPPPIASEYSKPDKLQLVKSHQSRFNVT